MTTTSTRVIRTPDQRLRVFVSSTLQEVAEERQAARQAIERLHLSPVMFELGARPHPPKDLYRAYLDQSHIFLAIYWQRYGWVAPEMTISGLEDEYNLSGHKPKLIYIKSPAPDREPRLTALLNRIKADNVSYKYFATPDELRESIENDLAMLLSERFEAVPPPIEPAAPSAASPRLHLPAPLTELVGRDAELAALTQLLSRDDVMLVTLTGPGGTGKSRLALQAALDTQARFADGAHLVALDTVAEPGLVPSAVAGVLDVRETQEHASIDDALIAYLRDKQLLLLLDNFEQIVEAAPFVADLLRACPSIKLLVTSRAPLRVRSEREFPVKPLALPPHEALADVAGLTRYAAIDLFCQRARDVKPGFALTADNAAAVVEICRRLDGLPLAIELAASRVKLLSPQALLARLERSLDVLSGGARDLPERQQTLRSAIDWSYNLLHPDGRKLLRRLTVFAGGCTLDAVDAVCNFDGTLGADTLDEMEALVNSSLLIQWPDAPGELRYGMLGTIREYVSEKLTDSGEREATQAAHAAYCLSLVAAADDELRGANQRLWLDRLELEMENFRAAHQWLAARPDRVEDTLRLAALLGWFWFVRGHWSEGRQWLDAALAQPGTRDLALRRRALVAVSILAHYQGDAAATRAYLDECRASSEAAGDLRALAYAYALSGLDRQVHEQLSEARDLGRRAVALFRQLGDRWGLGYALHFEGMTAFWQGDLAATRALYEESISQFELAGDRPRTSGPLGRLGDLAYRTGDYAQAQALYEQSLALYRELNDRPGIASALTPLGDVARARGDLDQAAARYAEALAVFQDLGDKQGVTWANYGLGMVARERGDWAQAEAYLQRSLTLLPEVGDTGGMAWVMHVLGRVKLAQANYRGALLLLQAALSLAHEMGHVVTLALCLPVAAHALIELGHASTAARLLGAAQALRPEVSRMGSAADVAELDQALAQALAKLDAPSIATELERGRALPPGEIVAETLRLELEM